MKYRSGFVTNSSSTSFIISARGGKEMTLVDFLILISDNNDGLSRWGTVLQEIEYLGNAMNIQNKIKNDDFWGHDDLKERVINQDTALFDKRFYEVRIERNWEEMEDALIALLNATEGIEIESREYF